MKKTEVIVRIGNETYYYCFPLNKEVFLRRWDKQLAGAGYFAGIDDSGNEIVINPSQCGIVEITEV